MKPAQLTIVLTLAVQLTAAVTLVVYDVFAAIKWSRTATISWEVLQISLRHPIIPLAVGFLTGLVFGHLFWSQRQ
jgi:hypothetical protein